MIMFWMVTMMKITKTAMEMTVVMMMRVVSW